MKALEEYFTREEKQFLIFFSVLISLGFILLYVFRYHTGDVKKTDYTTLDSLFNSVNDSNYVENQQKNVDSKPELLDFSTYKLNYKAKSKLSLADKSIDLNKAGFNDLILLPGIGEKTAAAIIELRKNRKKFSSIDELLDVKGIGEKKLSRIRNYLIIK